MKIIVVELSDATEIERIIYLIVLKAIELSARNNLEVIQVYFEPNKNGKKITVGVSVSIYRQAVLTGHPVTVISASRFDGIKEMIPNISYRVAELMVSHGWKLAKEETNPGYQGFELVPIIPKK